MNKFTTSLLIVAVLMTVAHADILEEFGEAAEEWLASQPALRDITQRQRTLSDYFEEEVGNVTCLEEISRKLKESVARAAEQWNNDKSLLGSIVSDMATVVFPALLVKGTSCVNPDRFRRDEAHFMEVTAEILKEQHWMDKTYDELSDELGFLTKGEIPTNQSCVQTVTDLLEVYRLSSIAEVASQNYGRYSLVAMFVYAYMPDAIKMSQKCLVGDEETSFTDAIQYWFTKNPHQKELYEQQDDQVVSTTKILNHDDECAQKLNDDLVVELKKAYTMFRNGTYRIGELANKLTHVTLVNLLAEARKCLLP